MISPSPERKRKQGHGTASFYYMTRDYIVTHVGRQHINQGNHAPRGCGRFSVIALHRQNHELCTHPQSTTAPPTPGASSISLRASPNSTQTQIRIGVSLDKAMVAFLAPDILMYPQEKYLAPIPGTYPPQFIYSFTQLHLYTHSCICAVFKGVTGTRKLPRG